MASLKRWVQVGQGQFVKWTEKGQELEGAWRGQKDGQYGPLGLLDTAEGRVSFPLHTALLSRIHGIRDGAEIRIIYTGKQMTRAGREFKAFEVFVASAEDLLDEPSETPF
jgi:hypothetical protein